VDVERSTPPRPVDLAPACTLRIDAAAVLALGARRLRVLRADGTCAPGVKTQQVKRLRAEGVVFKAPGRVDMAKARWEVED
jgi:hypothetical protein